ncbi:response regulator [Thermomonospora umbrina]|uniref:Response regulator receiver domain-containing protein n=1 Tax=Thermomonospora umbrina TaxID=111806 RepID=A0A3D9SW53_9ACTN|nr:response regulator [Thermomonospora umbrina]REF00069.1 response regulator receiver domain-containing protein [Thermomonospora umbrina]
MDDKAKILLVDDREENLVALEAILSSLDQDLVRARSGEEALKALLTDEYAVILLDVVMPGMDGFETARDIKRRKKTRDLPIIFLTAVNSDPDYAFRGYAAGAVDFIAKPFDPWVLRAKVSVFVELHRKNLQLREQAVLLRDQAALLRSRAGTPDEGPAPRLDELAERFEAVAEQVGAVRDGSPEELRAAVDELAVRFADLHTAFEALRAAGRPSLPSAGAPEA